ncbi:MAG: PDZ domain-containing protein, partial [Chloroflexota bacterium]
MKTLRAPTAIVTFLTVLLLTFAGTGCQLVTGAPTSSTPASPAALSQTSGDFADAIRQVAETVKPAVVQITGEQVQVDLFNRPFTVPAGVGSGVIYDRQGYILTNNHVVEGAKQWLISLPDGRSFAGQLVGADPQTDLAVMQISGRDLPVARLGDSSKMQVGDWVVAIGNALALPGGPTVTKGVVSALGRTVQEPSGPTGTPGPFLFDLIQTDAPINPGNSGGPLVNLQGEVIGLNTLVAGQSERGVQAIGIGFAISIATAKPIADQLVTSGRAIHPYLGINYVPLTPAIAAQLGIPSREGALVTGVLASSPAAEAGLRTRDVITQIDSTTLRGESALAEVINTHKPGDT